MTAAAGPPLPNASCHPLVSRWAVSATPPFLRDPATVSHADVALPVCMRVLTVSKGRAKAQKPHPAQAPEASSVAPESLPPRCGPSHLLPSSTTLLETQIEESNWFPRLGLTSRKFLPYAIRIFRLPLVLQVLGESRIESQMMAMSHLMVYKYNYTAMTA